MNKEDLKKYLENMQLEEGLQTLLFDLIEKASVVDQNLLNNIADILDLQADFYEQNADILEEGAELYEGLATELSTIDEEENADRMEALLEHQKTLLEDMNRKVEEVSATHQSNQINEVKQELNQISAPVAQTNTAVTEPSLQDSSPNTGVIQTSAAGASGQT